MTHRVLIVDDDPSLAEMLEDGLGEWGFDVTTRPSADEALLRDDPQAYAAIVTDLKMEGTDGLEFCRRMVEAHPQTPVVVMTAYGTVEHAVQAIRAGACDFLTKPFKVEALALRLQQVARHRELADEVVRLRRQVSGEGSPLLGSSQPLRRLRDLITRLCDSDATVLIQGETGSGKELVARALHEESARREGPFVAVNCAAMPENLLESELFGHVRGAFTDAKEDRTGLFLQAKGGTLFLDEVGELPPALQPKLLRALQERLIRPVGGRAEVAYDARVVAATNRDLEEEVRAGRFREDLYFRINVLPLDVPPLRDRGNDVLALAREFLATYAERAGKAVSGFSSEAAGRLASYGWPGNVRELQNCVERAVLLCEGDEVQVGDLPERVRRGSVDLPAPEADAPQLVTMAEVERAHILRVLGAVEGNKTQAAKILGLDRKTLYRKLERYKLED